MVAIYYHPEGYPPTLNAIAGLSSCFTSIEVIHRPHLIGSWQYPSNVTPVASGKYIKSRDQEQAPIWKKIGFFITFLRHFYNSCRRKRPSWILVYDPMALLAYYLLRPFLGFQHKIWYHNHDVADPTETRKYSLGWLAMKAESRVFKKLDVFSLPTDERLPYFKMNSFTGKYFYIPNYPSVQFYSTFSRNHSKPGSEVRIIFQGRIGEHHGLEEMITVLSQGIPGYRLKLVLKGNYDNAYREKIDSLAGSHHVGELIEWHGFSPYIEVPQLSSTCHIGIAIFAKKDIMNVTLGTASNKIYEYAAVGLPVVYLQDSPIRKHLEKFNWAFPVALSPEAIRETIEKITADYDRYSRSALDSFNKELNFEKHFEPVIQYIKKSFN